MTSALQAFSKAIANDSALREKATAILEADPSEHASRLAALASENGWQVSAEDFLAAASRDLSDADLASVAGGEWSLHHYNLISSVLITIEDFEEYPLRRPPAPAQCSPRK